MITIECDKCEEPFDVADDQAGSKVPCPHCGDINRVPVTDTAEPAAVASTAAAVPKSSPAKAAEDLPKKIPSEDLTGMSGEQIIAVIHPAMFRAHPLRGLLVVAVIVGGLTMLIGPLVAEAWPGWLKWVGGIVAIVGAVWLLHWFVRARLWIKLTISNRRTIKQEGIIRRHTTEVLHDHVRSVDIDQNFVQRIFDVGYLGIDSAGQDGIEVEVRDIPSPFQIKKIVDQHRAIGVGHD